MIFFVPGLSVGKSVLFILKIVKDFLKTGEKRTGFSGKSLKPVSKKNMFYSLFHIKDAGIIVFGSRVTEQFDTCRRERADSQAFL